MATSRPKLKDRVTYDSKDVEEWLHSDGYSTCSGEECFEDRRSHFKCEHDKLFWGKKYKRNATSRDLQESPCPCKMQPPHPKQFHSFLLSLFFYGREDNLQLLDDLLDHIKNPERWKCHRLPECPSYELSSSSEESEEEEVPKECESLPSTVSTPCSYSTYDDIDSEIEKGEKKKPPSLKSKRKQMMIEETEERLGSMGPMNPMKARRRLKFKHTYTEADLNALFPPERDSDSECSDSTCSSSSGRVYRHNIKQHKQFLWARKYKGDGVSSCSDDYRGDCKSCSLVPPHSIQLHPLLSKLVKLQPRDYSAFKELIDHVKFPHNWFREDWFKEKSDD